VTRPGRPAFGAPLTSRERQVAELAADGMPSREIADALFVSVRTVECHLWAAYAKTGTGSRVKLLHWLADNPDAAPAAHQATAAGQQ
jgi:DNA-binding NarL/FixJ family response regulator